MALSFRKFVKYTCVAVGLSWFGSQGLLFYHLKYGPRNDPLTHISEDAIPLSIQNTRQSIIDAVLGLYKLDYTTERVMYYDEKAIFEDPGLHLEGRVSLASAYRKMKVLFRKSENLKVTVLHGKHLITIDQVQRYTLPGNISFDLDSVIYLYLHGEAGEEKIVHHVEEWGSKHLLGKHAPYFGRIGILAAQFRKLHGLPFKYI